MQAYLAAQHERGRPTVLAFPTLYPREVVTALDACAWERWSTPPSDVAGADAGKLQGYLCPTVRGAQSVLASLERITPRARAVIIPHTCDSMQGLASIALSTPSWDIPILTFRHPRGTARPASRLFLREEVLSFVASLEKALDRKLEPERLRAALVLHRHVEDLLRRLLGSLPSLTTPGAELYATLRKLEYLHPEDAIPPLEQLLTQVDPKTRRQGVGLVLSGMVPEPEGLIDTLEDAGGFVAADDYAAFGRRIPSHAGPVGGDPIDDVVERLLHMPPCPTRASDAGPRIDHLRTLARDSGARGVILHTVKFCEPELFDIATLRRALESDGLGVLHVETEFEGQVTGQMATRVEAFLEMLSDGRRA
jgi:benzoyl-CoA reductase/2-hydroxyglutaryl-CoA dehydratase subunit BcrC/BadD/HgdB